MKEINNVVNGDIVKSKSGKIFPVFNPSTGKQIAQVNLSSAKEVDEIVKKSKKASYEWANTPSLKRIKYMFNFKYLLNKHQEQLANIVSQEQGKTYEDALGEVARGIEVVDYACGIPSLLKGEYSRNVGPNVDTHTIRHALGVCVGITPLNFPFMVPMWMFPISIACGNTFILKPSEKDPSVSLYIAKLFKEAGFPDGVLNVVQGDKVAVNALLKNEDVNAISFVGSTPVAQYIHEVGCANNKRVQALGGAKNHMILMPDADIKNASNALLGAAYGAAGERCMALSVVLCVGDGVADKLIDDIVPKVKNLKIGTYGTKDLDMGPLVTKDLLEKVKNYVDIGVKEGAKLVVDGRGFKLNDGYFIGGCLFDNVSVDMSIAKEEIFGPVLCVIRVKTYEEALNIIQNHEYGNGTAIFTNDGEIARHFSDNVNIGMVGINVPIPVPVAYHSFGGWKRSLFGEYSIYGEEGVRFNTKLKTITTRWVKNSKESANFAFPSNTNN